MSQLVSVGKLTGPAAARAAEASPYPAAIAALEAALTATGYWPLLDALYVGFGAPDQATARQNLVDPQAFTLSFGSTATWTAADGFMPDGTSTGTFNTALPWNNNARFKTANCCVFTVHKENAQANSIIGETSNPNLNINPRNASDQAIFRLQASNAGAAANSNSIGTYLARRQTIGGTPTLEGFMNGVSLGTSTGFTSQNPTSATIRIGQLGAATFSDRKTLMVGIGACPTDQQVADITAACRAYCNAIEPGTHP